ncbi:hypothetical protein BLOT_008767 [Blomia tropicalis]|nr:hypothetical protein BLOT_008767 [Blomia tropicalis]
MTPRNELPSVISSRSRKLPIITRLIYLSNVQLGEQLSQTSNLDLFKGGIRIKPLKAFSHGNSALRIFFPPFKSKQDKDHIRNDLLCNGIFAIRAEKRISANKSVKTI